MSFLQTVLQALFGALLDSLRAYQADKALEELGYQKGLREAAVAQIKGVNAVVAAQQKMAAIPSLTRDGVVDSLRRGEF